MPRRRQSKWRWSKFFGGHLPLESETAAYILVSAFDVLMTAWLLTHHSGRFVESNPVARFFIYGWGLKGMVAFKFALVAFVTVLTQVIALKNEATAERLLNFATAIVAGVVIYSLVLLLRHG